MNTSLQNPRHPCLFLYKTNTNTIRFSTNRKTLWTVHPETNTIKIHNLYLTISKNSLVASKRKTKWIIKDKNIFHKARKLYITCDYKYTLSLTNDPNEAIHFTIENNIIYYIKTDFQLDFERKTLELNLNIHPRFRKTSLNPTPTTVAILLAGGTSSRFNSSKPKQLYYLNGNPVISYSIDAILPAVDRLVIVTNTPCYEEIYMLTNQNPNISIVINDINCRLESIAAGVEYSKSLHPSQIIIHDSARPYITSDHIQNLLESNKTHVYSQYSLKLVNGLVLMSPKPDFVDREKYIEACTPLCIQFDVLAFFIQYMRISHRISHEFLPFLNLFKLKYIFIEGNYLSLRKLTTLEDIL